MGYIKQITIQGFKSYKEQTQIEPFSPKSNVIVGRNGSGKSNFFAAVRFVLGDDYHHMSREERQALLHEGSGSAVMSAYVEVCFDNSQDRFHTGRPEFYLRRTIGQKKDEYSIDRRNATKADVQQVLESAGFSRSNPYYIVPQGRVTALTNMKDVERLNLLKEISGSNVYETRRSDSLKLLSDTDNRRAKIDDLVHEIENRLEELEGERKELEEYNKRDREKRCLLYVIHSRDEERYQELIDEVDARREKGMVDTDENREMFIENENEMKRIDSEIDQLKAQIDLLRNEREQLEGDRRDSARNKAKIELDYKELTDGQSAAQKARKRHESELANIQQQIKAREDELAQILPQYNAKKSEESDIRAQLAEAEGQRKRLEDKQGRTAFYKNKRQRDEALRQEIDSVHMDLATRKAVLMETNEEVTGLQQDMKRLESEISTLRTRIENQSDDTLSYASKVQEARDAKERLTDQKKELWREDAKLTSQFSNAESQLHAAERTLSHLMDHNSSKGLETLRRLKTHYKLDGVYGTVAELLKVNNNYKTATEVTAGASLFHVVCDNDSTATKVVELLTKEKGGRLTCIPLNRVKVKNVQLPRATDAQPLLSKIEYDPKFDRAFQHIFGKTIICPDLTIAAGYARTHGVNALTPDGDKADKKGVLFGGYADPSKSRLDAVHNVQKLREIVETHRARRTEIKRELERLEQLITAALSDLRKIEHEKDQAEGSYGPLRQELRAKQKELQDRLEDLEEKRRTASTLESSINDLGARQSDLEAELGSEFKKALSTQEEQILSNLTSTVQDLRRQLSKITAERSDLEGRKAEIEVELRENLQPSLDQLLSQDVGGNSKTTQSAQLKECERSLKSVNRTLATYDTNISQAEAEIEQLSSQLAELQSTRVEKESANRDLAKAIERQQKRMDRSMQDRAQAMEDLARVQKEIRELGSLPEEAWSTYKNWSSEKASQRLRKVNESLKKFSHVNKKAFEQYENFTKQRRTLKDRQAELDTSHKAIEDLIQVLDQRKDQAIERTFKQVSKAFSEVFVQLVPAGTGKLVIQRKSDKQAGRSNGFDDESSDDERNGARQRRSTVENYTGVGISVSFNSKHDEQQRIQQLSGGQKSLCALALVFAIQQCDPAPFYLFDEIDANLDAQYRTAVAEMLKKLSGKGGEDGGGGGQFICTTFRPEMVLVAEKCYGVSYSNKTSSIDVVDREAALDFVEGMQKG
ncbi:putative chromosome segregation protein SudA [Sporormia fimetaria CBS 119925]|uniref:Structural maintenance of chromosomes protein n=1 Tax=Sporormia fimetaria CBS 119925 TaxID=1340428 RepID=A0A6A6VBW3_9PLEO|nr:putative chromosome segregation protein SudA [Sporormia fimetaria CBS 119925]